MLSLAKTWTLNGLVKWYARITSTLGHAPGLVVEPKIDGVGIDLTYVAGALVSARTRSGHASLCLDSPDLPLLLTEPVDVVVRGEVWIPRTEAGAYSSPRTAAVAHLQSEPMRPVRVICYDVESEPIAPSAVETRAKLARLGLPVFGAEGIGRPANGGMFWDAVSAANRMQWHGTDPSPYPYAIDGAVLKVAGTADRQRLGCTATAPRWAMALKWATD
jgi:DNA ligase (NAD+)